MSRKPCVVSSAQRGAAALQDGVDRDRGAVQEQPRRAEIARRPCSTPFSMPVTSRAGVVSVLPSRSSPVVSSNAATSVKVPPTSAESRIWIRFHRIQTEAPPREIRPAERTSINRGHAPQRRPVFGVLPSGTFARNTGITSPANRPIDCRLSPQREIAEGELPDHVVAPGLGELGERNRVTVPASRRCPGRARPPDRRSRGADATASGHAAGTDR